MKTYRVVGNAPAYDTQPGETFSAELTPEQEQRMVAGGVLEVVSGDQPSVPESASPLGDEDEIEEEEE